MQDLSLKRCKGCLEEKPRTTEFFYSQTDSKDGLRSVCRACRRKRVPPAYNVDKVKKPDPLRIEQSFI